MRFAALALLLAAPWVFALDEPPNPSHASRPRPLRFLLTFDDGPYGQERDNPTANVLDTLADNPVQRNIKAIFFVQTRSSDGGATAIGRAMLRREQQEGHLVALHDGSSWGHRSHRNLTDDDLEASLRDGIADLAPVIGHAPRVLRPPYWAYDQRTLAAYARHGLSVLLTDVSANDGKDWGYKASPRRRSHLTAELARVRERIERGDLPVVDGVIPVVAAFHDSNTYTAQHMPEYLEILVELAGAAGLEVSAQPYFNDRAALERAALVRARDTARMAQMVPWWWRWILW